MADGSDTMDECGIVPLRRARRPARLEARANALPRAIGSVALVGAGPGDPELLTLKAVRHLRAADAVVHDRLVSDAILALAPRAERFYVGKARNRHALPQDSINALLVRLAREGKRVVRLKGGDPFIFGRGGEEIETLAANAIPFEVVPGISAANGIAAAARIPLTHRDHAQALVFVTGHLQNGTMDLDWDALARPRQTLVVYMGLLALPLLCRELVRHGLPPDTPAAVVSQGTLPMQRVVTGTLEALPGAVADAALASPTLIIVGDVVGVREATDDQGIADAVADILPFRSASRSVIVAPSAEGAVANP
jgi:uroporphyrin-III C-methyltransferase/precorrin-2 dehydrogenase/sirohydrochlorin ferrochelatase